MARTARRFPMSHLEVVRAFIRGQYRRGSSLFGDKSEGTLFSYGRHFPLVVQLPGGFLVNGSRYSVSTARHQTGVAGACRISRALRGSAVQCDRKGNGSSGSQSPNFLSVGTERGG